MSNVLDGIKVLDFTTAIAGSYAIRFLGDLGADVIKIESFDGDSFRSQIGNFIVWNVSKRGMVIDLKQEEGKEIVRKLVKGADVVAHNYRASVAKKLELDYETLNKINPRLVYSSESAWGDDGPYGGKAGFDPVLQAESGIMASQGYKQQSPVDLSHAEVDVATTTLHTFAIMAALFVRARTGKGQHVKTTLLDGALSVQPDTFVFYANRPEQIWAGPDYLGPSATTHLYKTKDRWLMIDCTNEESWLNLCDAVNKPDLKTNKLYNTTSARIHNSETLTSIFNEVFTQHSAEEWLSKMYSHRVPASPINDFESIPTLDLVLQNGLLAEAYEPIAKGKMKQVKTMFQLSETPSSIQSTAPLLGEHTQEILKELNYTDEHIGKLRSMKVIP